MSSAASKEGSMFMHSGSGSVTTGALPLPGIFETMTCRLSMFTSWVFDCFKGDLSFGHCNHKLHLPIMQDVASCPFSVAVLFKACKGRLAVLYISKTIYGDMLHDSENNDNNSDSNSNNSPLSRETCL